jgi:S-(hydroxymethyl)glutathione dehydrogenase/alcohol dehydrogenase
VFGVGGVGMAAVAGAAHAGASRVVAVDTSPWKTQQAMSFGATHHVTISPNADDVDESLRTATGGRGADVSIITVGAITPEVFRTAIRCLDRGGRLVTVAIGAGTPIPLPIGDLNIKELTIMGSLMGSTSPKQSIDQLVSLYRAGRLDLDRFVTERYPLDRINDACAALLAGNNIRGVLV